jgi:hypothetical protein
MCSTQPEDRSTPADPAREGVNRAWGLRDGLFVGLLVITLMRPGEAAATERAALPGSDAKPNLQPLASPGPLWPASAMPSLPDTYRALDLSGGTLLPPPTFRPRGRSILDKDDEAQDGPTGAPLMRSTTVWQRLSDYRARDHRVRVLTLWEAGGTSLSLQAGRRGDPSLQWTSRMMSRGGSTHGLLDEVFKKSLGAVLGRGLRGASRSAVDIGGRSERLPEAGKIP